LVHAKASGNSPRLVLTYHPIDDTTIYATAARGYRPGGPNVGLPTGIGCTLNNAYSPLYQPDTVWNYELGAKLEFLDRRLSIDVAAYRIDWKNVQQAVTDPGCGYLFVANVGTREQGFEAEINFKPVESLLLSASGSYDHAEFTSIDAAFQGAGTAQPGEAVPSVPRQKFNLGGEYTSRDRRYTGYMRLDWSHLVGMSRRVYLQRRAARVQRARSSGRECARTLRSIALWPQSYEFERYFGDPRGSDYSFGNTFTTQISTPPRTVGIDLKMHF
jgi:iron complex outermembrane receptor protein